MKAVANVLGVSRSNLHDHLRRGPEPRRRYHKAQDAVIVPLITALVAARPTYGYSFSNRAYASLQSCT